MSAETKRHEFATGEELADALARAVARQLSNAVKTRGRASLAVSGGSTPPPFFRALSRQKLPWENVTVTLVDERLVPPSSERSNARLVAQHLLQNDAAKADFIGLHSDTNDVSAAAERASTALSSLPQPIDMVVLGMGTDKHTASFFPDAANISELLEGDDGPIVRPVTAPSAGEPRLTLSMGAITGAAQVALHIEGIDKKEALNEALRSQGRQAPIRAVIERAAKPVHVYWAPKSAS
ncbi:6-phosphogluconolactonase [Nitratireductor thuwali]|uniref:6-phosphogluconolactonase n=1 Tax=Nitratireductor thuwali TaxID=2267699 RepID=A0ABY5MK95_9HYPH|nr:6-phosphogluconolactonase [Nitratireductor thuwali]